MNLQRVATLSSIAAIAAGILAACGGDDSTTIGNAPDSGVGPDGNTVLPDGSTVLPDGAVVGPDGSPINGCTAPLTACGAECTNTATDPGNCGSCGTTCDTSKGLVCSQGACGLTCGGGTTKCGTLCIDTVNDPKNCGSCGMACGSGQVCEASMCVTPCPSGQVLCGSACASTQTDVANCGKCGNACPLNNTCSAGACVATLANTSSVLVSTLSCSTASSYSGRKAAVDTATNELFVAMNCGGDVQVATSDTGGVTFAAPVDLKTTSISDTAIVLDSSGNAYVGVLSTAGTLSVLTSADHGQTWSSPTQLETGLSTLEGLSMDVYKSTLYVAGRTTAASPSIHLWRSGATDAGSGFGMTNVAFGVNGINPFDVVVDQSTGDVWVVGDVQGVLLNAKSTDGGVTFGGSNSPAGNVFYTDAALSSGTIFMAGNADALMQVPTKSPATDTSITGFGAGVGTERSIAADSAGDLFVATTTLAGKLVLQHVPSGGSSIDKSPVIAPGGDNPVVVSAGSNVALVAYSASGGVYARVMKF